MSKLPTADPSVIFQKLDDGAVLFAPETEIYFGLNEVGACVWQNLPPATRSVEELCTRISAAYPEVAAETIRTDVTELLHQLVNEGLARGGESLGLDASAGT